MTTLKITHKFLILFIVLITIWWSCSLEKIDPSVKFDPCLGKVTAKFTHDKIGVTCDSPCVVKFTNQSIGAKSYAWNFGEGGTSNEQNPTYTFKKAGKWDVKLTATGDNGCSAVFTESVTVNTPVRNPPIADFTFTFSNNNQFATTTVNFSSISKNAVSHKWTFDDNNETSVDISTSHVYKIAKGYNVTLEVTNADGLKNTKTIPVNVLAKKFTVALGGTFFDNGRSVQQTRDGGYITCGYTTEGLRDVMILKTDSAGRPIPSSKVLFGGQLDERGYAIQQTTLGGYVMTGYTNEGLNGSSDMYLVITDVTGSGMINTNNSKFGGIKNDGGYDVKQTQPDGGFIICGYTESIGSGNSDAYLVKTNNNGVLQWQKPYGKANFDVGYSVQQTSNGFIMCGTTDIGTVAAPNRNIYLVKTNTNGDTIWTKNFGGMGSESGSDVQITKDGGYIISGSTTSHIRGKGGSDMYLIRTNADGVVLWDEVYGGTLDDNATSVQETADGGYAICGSTYSSNLSNGANDVYFIITDDKGKVLKEKHYGGRSFEEGFCIRRTTDGGYIICGYTYSIGAGGSDFYLIKTDKDGNEL
jgi:PKD repeat protein